MKKSFLLAGFLALAVLVTYSALPTSAAHAKFLAGGKPQGTNKPSTGG
jgi:hypothetical protein